MKLDDNILTTMVDAAAKGAYQRMLNSPIVAELSIKPPEWDELPPLEMNRWRQHVLPTVWDAVEAMPDIRHTVWLEGYIAADNGRSESTNPYPAPEVPS